MAPEGVVVDVNEALAAALALHKGRPDANNWYAGVTNDPDRRLGPAEHNVDLENGRYGIQECRTVEVALAAEGLLHDWGYRGQAGGGVADDSVFVYVYKITKNTCESC